MEKTSTAAKAYVIFVKAECMLHENLTEKERTRRKKRKNGNETHRLLSRGKSDGSDSGENAHLSSVLMCARICRRIIFRFFSERSGTFLSRVLAPASHGCRMQTTHCIVRIYELCCDAARAYCECLDCSKQRCVCWLSVLAGAWSSCMAKRPPQPRPSGFRHYTRRQPES